MLTRTELSVSSVTSMTATSEISASRHHEIRAASVDDLCDYFEEKYRFDVPTLHEDQIVAGQIKAQIDVS